MYVCPLDLDMPTAAVTGRVAKEDEDYDSDLRTGMQHAGGERREPRNMNGNGTGFSDRNSFGPPQVSCHIHKCPKSTVVFTGFVRTAWNCGSHWHG